MTVRYASPGDSLYQRFTEGECDLLAIAISNRTGWPVIYLWNHAVVELPDGRYLDVSGTMTRRTAIKRWGEEDDTPWRPWPDEYHRDPKLVRTAEELIALVMTEDLDLVPEGS